jgi:D-3-phosphoglycerate dehydrogenase / 2-oxoglutarate reductase
MKTVLVNKPTHQDALDLLSKEVNVLAPYTASEDELIEMLPDVHGIMLMMGLTMTGEVIAKCKNLEIIGRHGAGYDIVDLEAAAKQGVIVTNTPYGPTESTAELAFLLMMAAARSLTLFDRAFRKGDFHIRQKITGRELLDKNVGVLGFGRIGSRFAEMCKGAFNMNVYVYDPVIDRSQVEDFGAVYMTDLMEMAGQIDFLSVHCPLIPQTRHIINAEVLEAMKPEAYLINASRGPTVDEEALIAALKENKIAGAGLDVFDQEPPATDNPLFSLDNVVLTPHVAGFTDEGKRRMGVTAAEDILRVLRGEKPVYPVTS